MLRMLGMNVHLVLLTDKGDRIHYHDSMVSI
jgi:hypothetical protein